MSDNKLIDILVQEAELFIDRDFSSSRQPNWLINCDFESNIWNLENKVTLNFDIKLYDIETKRISSLTDKSHEAILTFVKDLLIYLKTNSAEQTEISASSLLSHWKVYSLFIRWIYLHNSKFLPDENYFRLVTAYDYEDFVVDYSKGKNFEVLRIGERISYFLEKLTGSIYKKTCLNGALPSLNYSEVSVIKDALYKNGYFRKTYKQELEILELNRDKLSDKLGLNKTDLKNVICRAFFRQFETGLNNVLVTSYHNTANFHPSHKDHLISELLGGKTNSLVISQRSVTSFLSKFCPIFRMENHHLFHNYFDLTEWDYLTLKSLMEKNSRPKTHTPLIPTNVSLHYLNVACRIISYDFDVLKRLIKAYLKWLKHRRKPYNHYKRLFELCKKVINEWDLSEIYFDEKNPFDSLQRIFQYIIDAIIGACIYLIASQKPSRNGEVTDLNKNSIELRNDGYWLVSKLRKANFLEDRLLNECPIPNICNLAELRIEDITAILKSHNFDDLSKDFLFKTPLLSNKKILKPTSSLINSKLARFCDAANYQLDNYGRRWYVKTHECRKFWIVALYNFYPDPVALDICRRAAGHVHPEHTMEYIEASLTEHEKSHGKVNFTVNTLKNNIHQSEDITELRSLVLKAFGVNQISEIPEGMLNKFIERSLKKGNIKVTTIVSHVHGEEIVRLGFLIKEASDG